MIELLLLVFRGQIKTQKVAKIQKFIIPVTLRIPLSVGSHERLSTVSSIPLAYQEKPSKALSKSLEFETSAAR
jgi:hypothetical protein